jgi:two-component system, NarL family, nitrate/nitrite response regulator NarL
MTRSDRGVVMVVDQHALFVECLGIVLETRNYAVRHADLPPHAARTDQVVAQLRAARPDIALINADLGPTCDAVAVVAEAVESGIAVAVLSDGVEEADVGRFLAAGARVVVSKGGPLAAVVGMVRRLAQGQSVLDREERSRLIGVSLRRDAELRETRAHLARLSPQEAEVLRHLMAGRSVRDVAAVRHVSEATVRTQVKAVLGKLEVSSQLAAVAAARSGGWAVYPWAG